jgi:hypothetical protein
MRSERGQATVEWIAVVLLVAIALAAAARFAPRDDDRGLPTTLVHSLAASTHRVVGLRSEKRIESRPPRREAFTAPLLVPHPGPTRHRARLRLPTARTVLRWARREGRRAARQALGGRVRRGVGVAWRRAWFACLAYERFRFALLHPESRFPGYTMPPSEVLRIANDCLSPVDMVRDWPLLRAR